MRLILRWLMNVAVIMLIAYVLPAVELTAIVAPLVVAVVLAVLNTFVRPIFKVFALPLNLLTLGLFTLVVNLALIEILDWLLDSLQIRGFWWAILLALIVSVVTPIINIVIGNGAERRHRQR